MAVYMKDWFGGRNDMLHYLRTGELQHRMGRLREVQLRDGTTSSKANEHGRELMKSYGVAIREWE